MFTQLCLLCDSSFCPLQPGTGSSSRRIKKQTILRNKTAQIFERSNAYSCSVTCLFCDSLFCPLNCYWSPKESQHIPYVKEQLFTQLFVLWLIILPITTATSLFLDALKTNNNWETSQHICERTNIYFTRQLFFLSRHSPTTTLLPVSVWPL